MNKVNKSEQIKLTINRMLQTTPLKDITVQNLCKESGVKRQTFYYYFNDINDVMNAYFLTETIDNLDSAQNYSNLVHLILQYASSNRQVILKTLKSNCAQAVENFFYNNLYNKGKEFIKRSYGNQLNQKEISEISKLISDAISREMSRLLTAPNEMQTAEIEENISKTFDGVLDLICSNKIKKKRKK